MKPNIFFHTMGGLGNQMFQYAFAKSLTMHNQANLFVDDTSGFLFDYEYKRKYELENFNLHLNKASSLEKITFLYYQAKKRFFNIKKERINKFTMLREFDHRIFNENIAKYKIQNNENLWIKGYWQSEKYFENNKNQIFNDFKIKQPNEKNFLEIAEKIKKYNSVSIGIRGYEEVKDESKSFLGGLTNINFYKSAIEKIRNEISKPVFFIFSTKNFPIIKELQLDEEKYLINNDNGFSGTFENLWLMSLCKNHIISNSSFYWWAAWLSEFYYKQSLICASSNFSNKDAITDRWIKI